ncbi:MAG: methyltransferase family protein [Desulfopila sp.]
MTGEMVGLAAGWFGWCVLHSLLISPRLSSWFCSLLGKRRYAFRLLYNLFAGVTLAPLMVATALMPGGQVFAWQGGWQFLRLLLLAVAFLLYRGGSRYYDFGLISGIRQFRERRQVTRIVDGQQFCRVGVLAVIRHPWYLASFLVLWCLLPVYHLASVVAAAILSFYLLVGTLLEERKLLAEFGASYRRYQREVSMFIPVKWLLARLRRKDG